MTKRANERPLDRLATSDPDMCNDLLDAVAEAMRDDPQTWAEVWLSEIRTDKALQRAAKQWLGAEYAEERACQEQEDAAEDTRQTDRGA